MKFKYNLYQECMQILSLIEQKKIVELMRMAEQSNNMAEFLFKSENL